MELLTEVLIIINVAFYILLQAGNNLNNVIQFWKFIAKVFYHKVLIFFLWGKISVFFLTFFLAIIPKLSILFIFHQVDRVLGERDLKEVKTLLK